MTPRYEEVHDTPVRVTCEKCGRVMTLWFNGGELDRRVCCGLRYELTYRDAPLWLEIAKDKDEDEEE